MWRKIGLAVKPNVVISIDGNVWSIKSVTSFFKFENSFTLDKEFEETLPDGRKVMVSIISWHRCRDVLIRGWEDILTGNGTSYSC